MYGPPPQMRPAVCMDPPPPPSDEASGMEGPGNTYRSRIPQKKAHKLIIYGAGGACNATKSQSNTQWKAHKLIIDGADRACNATKNTIRGDW